MLDRIARRALANPRRTMAIWGACIGLFALLGFGVESRLHRSSIMVPGTTIEKTERVTREHFGEEWDITVLLLGPRSAVETQGRRVAAALARQKHAEVITPWMPGAGSALRPTPGKALMLVRFTGEFEQVSRDSVPAVRRAVDRLVKEPVKVHVGGYPDIANGIHGGTLDAIKRAELIAGPLLLLVLLLVFRSPIAALLPLMVGFATIGASKGVLSVTNEFEPLDALALNMASMMGLALGVDYALLLVSRFREELADGAPPKGAARVALATAGKTIVFAGVVLGAAMLAGLLVSPGSLLASASFGMFVPIGISVITALTALPAMLTILGPKVNRWSFGGVGGDSRLGALALRALRRPALAMLLVGGLVLALAAPGLGLQSGPPDPRELPSDSRERQDYEALKRALGSGWIAPYEVNLVARGGRITDHRRLAAIAAFERRMIQRRDVRAVLGPGEIARRTRPLERASGQLAGARRALREGVSGQTRLVHGLDRAGSGAQQLRSGLADAAAGASKLAAGGDDASTGASQVSAGIESARVGAERLRSGLGDARTAVASLTTGSERARDGVRELVDGLRSARAGVSGGIPSIQELRAGIGELGDGLRRLRQPAQIAESQLREGMAALDAMQPTSKADAQYRRAYEAVATALGAVSGRDPRSGAAVVAGYPGMDAALEQAAGGADRAGAGVDTLLARTRELDAGLGRLVDGSSRLEGGIADIASGTRRLDGGLARLSAGGGDLSGGIGSLAGGAASLESGVARLRAGAGDLGGKLSSGSGRVGALTSGIDEMRHGVVLFRAKTRGLARGAKDTDRLGAATRSGYFTLAAIDTSSPAERTATGFAINLDRGGDAARITIVGSGNAQKAGHPLRAVLQRELEPLSKATRSDALLGGTATGVQDFDTATSSRFPLLVIVLVVVSYLVLMVLMRSLILPLLAVVFNVLTVIAAFGVLTLLFQGGDPPLGGPGFLDAITVSGVFSVMYGLSIDYEVFLLTRMREGYDLTGTTQGAIEYGLRRTAGVVTGAALIMAGVFFAFATTDLATTRELGVGLTVAVLLDATLVRLILLPGALRLIGDRAWHRPRFLMRLRRRKRVDATMDLPLTPAMAGLGPPTDGERPSKEGGSAALT